MRRRRWRLALLAALFIGAALVWAAWPPAGNLLQRAMKVADFHVEDYCWLSGHEALFFRRDGSSPSNSGPEYQYSLERTDIQTGKRIPLTALARIFNASGGYCTTARLSPDRRWLLWMTARSYVAASLDGKQHYQWPMRPEYRPHPIDFPDPHNTGPCWLRDSRRWVELEYFGGPRYVSLLYERIRVHSLDTPHSVRIVSIPLQYQGEHIGESLVGEGPSAGDRFLFWRSGDVIREADFSSAALRIIRQFNFPKPTASGWIADAAISPQGDRTAWLVRIENPPAVSVWLCRLLPFLRNLLPSLNKQGRPWTELWVSGLDGSGMRQIGSQEFERKFVRRYNMTLPEGTIDYLRWLPDGKRLSFVYRDALYIIPAD